MPTLIVLIGPTGVGKTELSLRLAENFQTHIVSADSRQLYAELKIVTATPTPEQLERVPHHLVGTLHLTDYYSAAQYETEAMEELLQTAGYDIVPFTEQADVYVVNTCSVTNMAERKSRQMLHRAKKLNPEAVVVATGCYVQVSEEEARADAAGDLVLGNNQKRQIVTALDAYFEGRTFDDVLADVEKEQYEELEVSTVLEHTRAFVKVQDGCNQFCSYCIIPYARGRVRSRRMENVIAEIKRLAEAGIQEVVLTGIHLSSYGREIDGESHLIELIEAIHPIDGISRIRLGSLEPRIITEEFVGRLKKLHKVCPHFHLSLQSGCEETLKRMNRQYTPEEYYEK